jgi:hypothetical protein
MAGEETGKRMASRSGKLAAGLALAVWLAASLVFAVARMAGQSPGALRYPDNSDWWSGNRPDADEDVPGQKRELARTVFQIAGVQLGETMFRKAEASLGKAQVLERGDASAGRAQACYVSPGEKKVYLIFEEGELDYSFYLFAGGAAWNGTEYCTESKMVSEALASKAGMHLGQTPAQVMAILGPPAKRKKDELIFSTAMPKLPTAAEVRNLRERHPEMSEKELRENFGLPYTLNEDVDARFDHGKLVYLAVSWGEVE